MYYFHQLESGIRVVVRQHDARDVDVRAYSRRRKKIQAAPLPLA